MPYRDDLEAALAHADAAERDLAAAREENQHDHQRIAELEKQLAAAQHKLGETKKREPRPEPAKKPPSDGKPASKAPAVIAMVAMFMIAAGVVVAVLVGNQSDGKPKVDVNTELPAATERAKKILPDPELFKISADYVDAHGVSNLATYRGHVTYGFLSPSLRGQPVPKPVGPIGAPQPSPRYQNCSVEIYYKATYVTLYAIANRGEACGEPLTHPPYCTVAQVWAEAIRRGAPENALAGIRYEMRDHSFPDNVRRRVPVWRFSITDQSKTVFEMSLPDDECWVKH